MCVYEFLKFDSSISELRKEDKLNWENKMFFIGFTNNNFRSYIHCWKLKALWNFLLLLNCAIKGSLIRSCDLILLFVSYRELNCVTMAHMTMMHKLQKKKKPDPENSTGGCSQFPFLTHIWRGPQLVSEAWRCENFAIKTSQNNIRCFFM